jgi:hypothetical protein
MPGTIGADCTMVGGEPGTTTPPGGGAIICGGGGEKVVPTGIGARRCGACTKRRPSTLVADVVAIMSCEPAIGIEPTGIEPIGMVPIGEIDASSNALARNVATLAGSMATGREVKIGMSSAA